MFNGTTAEDLNVPVSKEMLLVAIEFYREAGGRIEHHARKEYLKRLITDLIEERDALKAENKTLWDARVEPHEKIALYMSECNRLERERDSLKTLIVTVYHAKGRYHSQIAMAALYEACGLPNVKPVSGGKS